MIFRARSYEINLEKGLPEWDSISYFLTFPQKVLFYARDVCDFGVAGKGNEPIMDRDYGKKGHVFDSLVCAGWVDDAGRSESA